MKFLKIQLHTGNTTDLMSVFHQHFARQYRSPCTACNPSLSNQAFYNELI